MKVIGDEVRGIAETLAAKEGWAAGATFQTDDESVVALPMWILYVRDAEKKIEASP